MPWYPLLNFTVSMQVLSLAYWQDTNLNNRTIHHLQFDSFDLSRGDVSTAANQLTIRWKYCVRYPS